MLYEVETWLARARAATDVIVRHGGTLTVDPTAIAHLTRGGYCICVHLPLDRMSHVPL